MPQDDLTKLLEAGKQFRDNNSPVRIYTMLQVIHVLYHELHIAPDNTPTSISSYATSAVLYFTSRSVSVFLIHSFG